ncbi:MAG: tryptophan-rich sensory protein [Lachnospiraceae bacterium]|nr:tryptophan-rich sensory protein [Lachnospiraceae bacterium]
MNSVKWKVYVFFILLSEAVGIVAGILTREGMQIYSETVTKPALTPPAIVFPIVWTILYALMGAGVAGVTLKPQSNERTRGLILYALQLLFNFGWSFIFFNWANYGFAFFWLLILIVLVSLMTDSFFKTDELSGKMQIPYCVWLAFAAYLNLAVWILNIG